MKDKIPKEKGIEALSILVLAEQHDETARNLIAEILKAATNVPIQTKITP